MDILPHRFSVNESHGRGTCVADEDETWRELPPMAIGQEERRLHLRAYNYWTSRLGERLIPSIEGFDPSALPDFARTGVLLDFRSGVEDPAVAYIGPALAAECGASTGIDKLSEVPERSLLSRVTEHYRQILANRAPIRFEAEFVNGRGATVLYRGILLPFSSTGEVIDHVFGVINWKELAAGPAFDALRFEIERSLNPHGHRPLESLPDPLGERLRALPTRPLTSLAAEGDEFALLLARRMPGGEVTLLGEIQGEPGLLESAAQRLLA